MIAGGALVLLVEDDDDFREIEGALLARAGFRIVEARHGQEALDLVEAEMPHLILLDMRMPVMDGWAFARELRARHHELPPIIVVSAAANARRWAEEIGADAAIGKPFEAHDLLAIAQRFAQPG